MSYVRTKRPVALSIGIMACNEEGSISSLLAALFRQSVFGGIAERGAECEIIVVANACTDRTAAVARALFARTKREHAWSAAWRAVVIEIPEACAGFALTLIACLRAHRLLRARSAAPAASRSAEIILSLTPGETK
jgi:glycosyltransferase involved in cell wall biosynthesis